jgi:hypothetical protein
LFTKALVELSEVLICVAANPRPAPLHERSDNGHDHIQEITVQLSVCICEAHGVVNDRFGVIIRPQNHALGI